MEERRLLVQWRNDVDPAIYSIGLLERRQQYRFSYLQDVRAIPGFRPFPSFPDFDRVYESDHLFDFFAARVMARPRPEYVSFVNALGLTPDADALAVLGRSGGRRKGDFVSVVEEPFVSADGNTSHTFLVHGVRHVADGSARDRALAWLAPAAALTVVREPGNPVNPRALIVAAPDGTALGWVPDGLVHYIGELLESGTLRFHVVRVNGADQPDQLRLLVQATGQLPTGAVPLPQLLAAVHTH